MPASNKWSRGWSKAHPDFALDLTPQGMRDFQSRRDVLFESLKAKVGEALLRAGILEHRQTWQRTRKHGIAHLFEMDAPALSGLAQEYAEWLKTDEELGKAYKIAWRKITAHQDTQYRALARQFLSLGTERPSTARR